MAETVRWNLYFPLSIEPVIERMRDEHRLTRNQAIVRAVGIVDAIDRAAAQGFTVGMCKDRAKLEIVLITPRLGVPAE